MYHILVIDDEMIIRRIVGNILTPEGMTVSVAQSAAEGLSKVQAEKPDLILLDVHLPDGYGVDVCKKIKADPKIKHIPVVIITGDATGPEQHVDGLEAGADDYVNKPFDSKELVFRVKRILASSVKPYAGRKR